MLPNPEGKFDANRSISFGIDQLCLPEFTDEFNLKAFLLHIERRLIDLAMIDASNKKSDAARILHIKRTTLVEKIRRVHKKEIKDAINMHK